MPSGYAHAAITTLAAGALLGAGVYTGQLEPAFFALAGGCLAGMLITPDLDMDDPVRSHGVVRRQAGLLPAVLWRALWLPYSRLIPHRHWLSHAPVIGTLGRVAYLLGVLLVVLALSGQAQDWSHAPAWWPWALAGLAISDALHWAADISASRFKRWARLLMG